MTQWNPLCLRRFFMEIFDWTLSKLGGMVHFRKYCPCQFLCHCYGQQLKGTLQRCDWKNLITNFKKTFWCNCINLILSWLDSKITKTTFMRALGCALIRAWRSSSDWLRLLALPVNHWNLNSWLAEFDVFPYMPIFPHPTPFKFSGENEHRSLFCGPLGGRNE